MMKMTCSIFSLSLFRDASAHLSLLSCFLSVEQSHPKECLMLEDRPNSSSSSSKPTAFLCFLALAGLRGERRSEKQGI